MTVNEILSYLPVWMQFIFVICSLPLICICMALAYAIIIYTILRIMELIERLWGGTTFLGFCSYVSPDERWAKGKNGGQIDLSQEIMERIRPSIKRERIIREIMES